MRPIKKQNMDSNAPATKGDIEQLREDLHADMTNHLISKQEFNKKIDGLVSKQEFNKKIDGLVSKQEFNAKIETLVSKREFSAKIETLVSKEEFNDKLEGMEDRVVDRVLNGLKVRDEQREAELQAAHEDELDIIAGKKEASPQWHTVPRRLKTAEKQIEKIKDHLLIS